jgi:hypothetical protein
VVLAGPITALAKAHASKVTAFDVDDSGNSSRRIASQNGRERIRRNLSEKVVERVHMALCYSVLLNR